MPGPLLLLLLTPTGRLVLLAGLALAGLLARLLLLLARLLTGLLLLARLLLLPTRPLLPRLG